jgi:hypothetical protein
MAATKQHVITIGSQKYAYRALPRYKDLEGVTGIKEASSSEKFTDNATSVNDLIRYNTGTSPNLKSKRMFGKYKQAPVKKKLPRLVRLDKIQNPNSHQGSHDSSLHYRTDGRTV